MPKHVFTLEEAARGHAKRTITDETRTCLECNTEKPIEDFILILARGRDVLRRCRTCRNRRNSEKLKASGKYAETVAFYRTREGKVKALWSNARTRAKRYGVPFALSLSDIVIPDICPLLGIPLVMDNPTCSPNSPTIDCRIPTLGYVPGNIWVISFRANTIKNDASLAELETLTANLRAALA